MVNIALYYNYKGDFIIKLYDKNCNIPGYYLMYISDNYCKVVDYMEQVKSIHNIRRVKYE